MAKEKNIFNPEKVLPKIQSRFGGTKNWLKELIAKRKKLIIGILVLLVVFVGVGWVRGRKPIVKQEAAKTITTSVDKNFDFPALNNQGKLIYNTKIKLKITNVEKTNQVMVKDQTYTAKNNKLFLIVNLEVKNDASQAVNILPGDLIRLSYNEEDNKFAPDLHNNLVPIAAISTRIDRVGFVIPADIKEFKLYVGELEGKKETVKVGFPS